jgi:eukaryotic-like serine/threonine-protein kinase
MKLPSGSRLGPYEVDALIGTGGMGAVYRARDTRLNRHVALKVLDLSSDTDQVARFAQEARTTALLNHPNVVSIYDTGSDNGLPFVVTELLRGETLRTRITRGALAVRAATAIAIEIAHGLTAAHNLHIVHRDLKPENVFITQDGRVKILDFGLAKCRHQSLTGDQDAVSTRAGMILGTVGYMSPEQVLGATSDARSDIFSLGVILHEMLSGTAPFHGDSAIETLHAILKDEAPPLPSQGISEQLQRVVQRCLEKKADARFQSAGDLAFVLEFMLPPSRMVSTSPRLSVARALLTSVLSSF